MQTEAAINDPSRRSDPEDYVIDLRQYVMVLWRRRWIVLVVTLTCGALSWGTSRITPPTYQATARLQLRGPGALTSDPSAMYGGLFDDPALAEYVVTSVGLNRPPHNLTPSGFRATALASRTAAPSFLLVDVKFLLVDVKLSDPHSAAAAANAAARRAVAMVQERDRDMLNASRETLRADFEKAERDKQVAWSAVLAFKAKSQIDEARSDDVFLVKQREARTELLAEIQSTNAQVKMLEKQLALSPRTLMLKRSINSEPEMADALRDAIKDPNLRLKVDLLSEVLNPDREAINQQLIKKRSLAAGLEAKKNYLLAIRTTLASRHRAEQNFELRQLESDLTRRQKRRDQLFDSYQQVLRDPPSKPTLQLVEEAVAPDRPLPSKSSSMIVAAGLATGLVLSMIGLFIAQGIRPSIATP